MPPSSQYTFEICVDSPAAVSAAAAYADRIELCSGLDVGGLTPDAGLMEHAASIGAETHVLIRPRSGDFKMTPEDMAAAIASIKATRVFGLTGVIIGAERNGALDRDALEVLARAADGLDLTLHRVIDVVEDPLAALNTAIDLGFRRILTSGAARSAAEGVPGLKKLHAGASNRIEIMAGGGINSTNLAEIMADTPITSFHTSCSRMIPLDERYASFGFGRCKRALDPLEAEKIIALLHSAQPRHKSP